MLLKIFCTPGVHFQQKSFQCASCDARFQERWQRTRHERAEHWDESEGAPPPGVAPGAASRAKFRPTINAAKTESKAREVVDVEDSEPDVAGLQPGGSWQEQLTSPTRSDSRLNLSLSDVKRERPRNVRSEEDQQLIREYAVVHGVCSYEIQRVSFQTFHF